MDCKKPAWNVMELVKNVQIFKLFCVWAEVVARQNFRQQTEKLKI